MIPTKHFYMIRHGETESNVAQVCAGDTDTPLTAKGRAEATAVMDVMAKLSVPPTLIFHSHLSRARDTATLLNQNMQLPMHEDRRLGERDFGDWHGISMDELHSNILKQYEPPNGEGQLDFRARVEKGIAEVLSKSAEPALIVCHGWVFRAFGEIYGITLRGVKNCQLYEFTPKADMADAAGFPWTITKYDPQMDKAA